MAPAKARDTGWGPVDAILALILLPFGIWFLAIEGIIAAIGRVTNLATPRSFNRG